MDYEKKYKEALEKIRSLHRDYNQISTLIDVKEELENIFPELAESEDERTWIINYLSNRILNSTIIAEKENLKKAIAWVEKQGEQKPDKVEPKFHEGDNIEPIDSCLGSPRTIYKICDGWYETNRGTLNFEFENNWRLVEQKPAIWSKEDKERLESCIKILQTSDGYDTINTKWLKSLKDRVQPQPKQEWSEEDEKMLNQIIKDYERGNESWLKGQGSLPFGNRIIWLKSLRPQNTWKPSELQIEALVSAIDVMIDNKGAGDKNTILLSGLYHKLKAL